MNLTFNSNFHMLKAEKRQAWHLNWRKEWVHKPFFNKILYADHSCSKNLNAKFQIT